MKCYVQEYKGKSFYYGEMDLDELICTLSVGSYTYGGAAWIDYIHVLQLLFCALVFSVLILSPFIPFILLYYVTYALSERAPFEVSLLGSFVIEFFVLMKRVVEVTIVEYLPVLGEGLDSSV